jgi:hypothetical protein
MKVTIVAGLPAIGNMYVNASHNLNRMVKVG